MSLFIAGLAFDPAMLNAAKLGILSGSAIAAVVGILILLGLTRRTRRIGMGRVADDAGRKI